MTTMSGKDDEIRAVIAELDKTMTGLRASVDAITAILQPVPHPALPAPEEAL